MEHFVTLFDSLFLPQGLALHRSMLRHCPSFTLWILCVDAQCHDVLKAMALPHVRLLDLRELETDELLRVKPGRGKGEYCWTLTPFAPRFVFEQDATVERVTYLDADLWFMKNPAVLIEELKAAGKQVLITDHGYAPVYDQSATSGRFCVQFVTFERQGGELVRHWWQERCIEWCFARVEDGKFGDQKYLDEWPTRFEKQVHVLEHLEWTLAPWNAVRFSPDGGVLWHFHGLRIGQLGAGGRHRVDFGEYPLPGDTIEKIYTPYQRDLDAGVDALRRVGWSCRQQVVMDWRYEVRRRVRVLRQAYALFKHQRIQRTST
jgi:hypothetical protein